MSKQNKDTNTTPSIQSIQNLGSAAKTTVPSNEFVVITKADNLAHNYFHYCEVYWDIGDCLSQAIIRFSKSTSCHLIPIASPMRHPVPRRNLNNGVQ